MSAPIIGAIGVGLLFVLPFLLAPLVLILLLLAFPGLALWLPRVLYG